MAINAVIFFHNIMVIYSAALRTREMNIFDLNVTFVQSFLIKFTLTIQLNQLIEE